MEDERLSYSISKERSFTGIIKLTLSHDLGANHLEEYNDCKQVELISVDFQRFLPIAESNKFLAGYFLSINEITVTNNSQVRPKNYCRDTGLRGPPIRS
jgi:hypothetical protein